MAINTAPPIGNFPGAQQRFGFTGTNPGEKGGAWGGGGFARGGAAAWRMRRPGSAMMRYVASRLPGVMASPSTLPVDWNNPGGGSTTPPPAPGGGAATGGGGSDPGDGYASDKPYGGGLPQLPPPPKYGGGGRGGYESEYGYVDNSQNNPPPPYQNPGGKGRPGDPGYYVGEGSPLYNKPFNWGNVYGRELGQPEAYPGFRPINVRKEDWANMTPEERYAKTGGPPSELRRLSDWSVNFRHGGFRVPQRQIISQGFPTGYGVPDDFRRRLAQIMGLGR